MSGSASRKLFQTARSIVLSASQRSSFSVLAAEGRTAALANFGRRRRVNEQQKWKPKGAVDEDLYKISPQLLCKKKLLRNLLGGCLGLSCIA
uniref:Uncharacterized protein n=1 Tax=Zea mays TaxID=4577 RepID=B6U0H5_MAIZE|nr:hypothetical protein [Zea mays]